jgi:hypothetical protein
VYHRKGEKKDASAIWCTPALPAVPPQLLEIGPNNTNQKMEVGFL